MSTGKISACLAHSSLSPFVPHPSHQMRLSHSETIPSETTHTQPPDHPFTQLHNCQGRQRPSCCPQTSPDLQPSPPGAPTPSPTTPMVVIQETVRPTRHLLLSLNKDPRILVLRQDFLDFIPGCSDGLDNPHWGEVFLGCHKNGIVVSLVEATQIQHQRLGVIDAFLLGPEWSEWWKLARLHQQPQQVLPKDIPAVLHKELLAQIFIAEGKAQMLRFPGQVLPVSPPRQPFLLPFFAIPKHSVFCPTSMPVSRLFSLPHLPFHAFFP